GQLNVNQGMVRLEFLSGAQVLLRSPSRLQLLSPDSATLLAGQAAARTPPEARGFVLNAPEAAIVDLGTEFAISVDERGQSEIHVVEGEVEISLLAEDGSSIESRSLFEANTLRVSRKPTALQLVAKPDADLPAFGARPLVPLAVPDAYVRSVIAS